MSSEAGQVTQAAEKMRAAGQTDEAIRAFGSALERVRSGAATLIASSELEPAPGVTALEDLPEADPAQALEAVALVKLNEGWPPRWGSTSPSRLSKHARDAPSWRSSSARRWRSAAATACPCRWS